MDFNVLKWKMRIFTLLYKCQIFKRDGVLPVIWITQGKCAIKTKAITEPQQLLARRENGLISVRGLNGEHAACALPTPPPSSLGLPHPFPLAPISSPSLRWLNYFLKILGLKIENRERQTFLLTLCPILFSLPFQTCFLKLAYRVRDSSALTSPRPLPLGPQVSPTTSVVPGCWVQWHLDSLSLLKPSQLGFHCSPVPLNPP